MHWFLIALGAPLLWSIVNHTDKFILSKYFKSGGAGGLMIFVAIVAIPIALIVYLMNPDVLSVSGRDAFILILTGCLYNAGVLLYLFALEREDASFVVPFWQLVPVFAYFLGVIFLHEFLSSDKLFAGLIVLLGAVILSLEFDEGLFSINHKTILTMIFSSFFLASGYILFKWSAIDDSSFTISTFWNQIGFLIFGIACYLVPKYKKEFKSVVSQNSGGVLVLNIAEQIVETLGVVISNFAILLAPAALVILVGYTAQPLFVFVEGILLTLLFPKFIKENLGKRHLAQKLLSIIIMGIGLYFVTT